MKISITESVGRSRFQFMLVRNISDCKMWHARTLSWQPVAPFRAKRRAKRTTLPAERGIPTTGWQEGDRGEGSDVVNAERSMNVITLLDFSSTRDSEDSRTNKRGIGKRISRSVKTCLCSRDKLSEL